METSVDGLQGRSRHQLDDPDRVLATVKHYAGDGDSEYGTSTTGEYEIDQGVTVTNRRDFARIDLSPYVVAIRRHDAGSVMPWYSSVDWTEDGVGNPIKMHANREALAASGRSTALQDAVLSVLRDAAQAREVAGRVGAGWASALADADHAQPTGVTGGAFTLLRRGITG